MVSFACKSISLEEIIKCGFQLTKTEYYVMMHLLATAEELTTQEIADDLKKERTTIQKAIKSLAEKRVVVRKQFNLEKGGYSFVYSIREKENLKMRILHMIDRWTSEVKKEVSNW